MLSKQISLLSSYFVNDPQDSNPPLLMAFYLFVLLLVSVSLILIIHNSFAVSMNARVHQFGIFSSIGATPGQIRTCLLQEAAMLCVIPVLIGSFVGIALTFGAIQAVNILADGIVGRHEAAFAYHPLVFAVTILTSFLTVLISSVLSVHSRQVPLRFQIKAQEYGTFFSVLAVILPCFLLSLESVQTIPILNATRMPGM